jgi:chloramphenicol-sensitive protein RarD
VNKGILYIAATYIIWGLFPVYWKWLRQIPASEILGHRIVWSFFILLGVILVSRQWRTFAAAARRVLRLYTVAGLLIGVNWLTYVWGVNAGYLVEVSLGYFIVPLFSVLVGVVFIRERLRPGQWTAMAMVAAGVLYLTFVYGSFPWISLLLAFTFGFYSLIKKTVPIASLHGVTLETGILVLPAFIYLIHSQSTGQAGFLRYGFVTDLLLIGTGILTSVPLLMFASATQLIPLSLIGVFQYIAPTLTFLLGVLVYGEPFNSHRLLGFAVVWAGLVVYGLEGFLARRRANLR